MIEPVPIIIPTRSHSCTLYYLVKQIRETADYPHKIIHTGSDESASCNRNLGLSQVLGEVAVMVDDDVEFLTKSTGWLRVMMEAFLRPEVVMVSAQLLNPNGTFSYMTGLDDCGLSPKQFGETVVPSKRLLTACCAFKHMGLRFDEAYVGSGFEDIDYCNRINKASPGGLFLVCHDAKAIHRNEQKNQRGGYWEQNKAHYESLWGSLETPEEMLNKWGHTTR